ncbi:MAG TPA: SDR family oxidoreductase [Humisphaera sp.]|jgi:hypothetical protein|nr:SDR family oxidoreductase [Humisphaera sp.]
MWFRAIRSANPMSAGASSLLGDAMLAHRPRPRHPRTVLITGASSGIGLEFARIFADRMHNLVLVSRDPKTLLGISAELERQHGVTVTPLSADLSTADSPDQILAELNDRSIHVDMLVNNAGFAMSGPFAQCDVATCMQLLQVNIVSLTHLTRLLLPPMVQRGFGRILNMASIAAFVPGPLTVCYNASKAFVVSLSTALSHELRDTGVTVTALCPGPTQTRFAERAGLTGTKAFSENVMDPADVARCGFDAMMLGKPLEVPGLRNKMRMLPLPWVPRRVLAHFSKKYHEKLPTVYLDE